MLLFYTTYYYYKVNEKIHFIFFKSDVLLFLELEEICFWSSKTRLKFIFGIIIDSKFLLKVLFVLNEFKKFFEIVDFQNTLIRVTKFISHVFT